MSAIIVAIPAIVIGGFNPRGWRGIAVASGISLVVLTGVNWLMFWKMMPVVSISSASFYQSFWIWIVELVIASALIGFFGGMVPSENSRYDAHVSRGVWILSALLIVTFLVNLVQMFGGIYTDGRAKQLAGYVNVVEEKPGAYPETDSNHIVTVPEQVARRHASSALNQGNSNLATNYELLSPQLQSIKVGDARTGHAYWVVALAPADWKTSNRLDDEKKSGKSAAYIPGYVLVDAEDPDATPQIVSKTTDGKPIDIEYTVGGSFDHLLDRHVWSSGLNGAIIDDWTLEVDDSMRPYWTATINDLSLNFQPTVPTKVVTVDAQTGEIKTYGFDQVPTWLDRIYSANTAKEMLNWWGDFAHNDYGTLGMFRNKSDRFQVHGDPVLVYTKEDYPVWQMELTSMNNDTSVSYIALFDGRWSTTGSPTDKSLRPTVRLYKIDDAALSSSVADSIKGAPKNLKKYDPTHIAIHKINGVMTWVAPLVPEGQGGADNSAAPQGIALVQADKPINGGNIVIGSNMNDALNQYATVLSTTGSSKPTEDASQKVVTGTIVHVSAPTTENNVTAYYFMLTGDSHVYRVTFNPVAKDANLEVPFIAVGHKVTVSYRDNGTPRRDVNSYDDLGIKIGS